MVEMHTALQHVLAAARPIPGETCSLDQALHRILRSEISAPHDTPPFTKSTVDGYAIRSEDLTGPVATFDVVDQWVAGHRRVRRLGDHEAVRIMTGAELPDGATAVVMQEDATPIVASQSAPPPEDGSPTHEQVVLKGPARNGLNILPQGSIYRRHEIVLPAQRSVAAAEIGLLAELGSTHVDVYRRPRVAILPTGDELVDLGTGLGPGKIYNSNGPMLDALCQESGVITELLATVGDEPSRLQEAVQGSLSQFDVLIVSGGVSVGIKDLVPQTFAQCGVSRVFHGVHMKPGKPLWFGVFESSTRSTDGHRCLVFGLPGNPTSVFVGFQLFVRAALYVLRGLPARSSEPQNDPLSSHDPVRNDPLRRHPLGDIPDMARLVADHEQIIDRPTWLPFRWLYAPQAPDLVALLPTQGSADLLSLSRADGLALFPTRGHYPAGSKVRILRW